MQDATPREVPLLPKLRGYFAEFLNEGSLERLRILSSSTCVGLRYGHPVSSLEDFLVKCADQFASLRTPYHLSRLTTLRICLERPSTGLDRRFHPPDGLNTCVPPSLKCLQSGTGILSLFSIAYALRPQLRIRLTLGGVALPRKP
jgi:hypothetical protein